jgi:hypothetical protein
MLFMTLREKALEIAKTQIGVQEEPMYSNWGPQVKQYLASVGIDEAAYWCAAFVCWCFDQASQAMGVKFPFIRTGGVMIFYTWVKTHHPEWIVSSGPMPGDIGILDFGNGKGHMFLVEAAYDLTCDTIEGNSNEDGSRNGEEVAHRTGDHARVNSKVKAFIRVPS